MDPSRWRHFHASFRSSCQSSSYREPTVSRGNEYGRSRWTGAKFQKELKPMNIVRYQRYPQTDLAAVLDRITSMQAEMDRVYNSTIRSSFRSPASMSRWNPAVHVYKDKARCVVLSELSR